jgi:hypothetical protein
VLAIPFTDISQCINEVALTYHIPAKLIISILEVEQGRVGQVVKNTNGTYDIGPMQINSIWLPELEKYHITQQDIQFNACANIRVGAWILSRNIANRDDVLVGIGDYHSHTKELNKTYSIRVIKNMNTLDKILNSG